MGVYSKRRLRLRDRTIKLDFTRLLGLVEALWKLHADDLFTDLEAVLAEMLALLLRLGDRSISLRAGYLVALGHLNPQVGKLLFHPRK